MKQIGMLALLTSASAFAFPGVDTLKNQAIERAMRTRPWSSPAQSCANFSGTWKGVCGESKEPQTMTIEQKGCESLKIEKEEVVIGTLNNMGSAHAKLATAASTVTDWSKDGQSLDISLHAVVKPLGQHGHFPIAGAGALRLSDPKKLNLEFEILGFKLACVYDKQ